MKENKTKEMEEVIKKSRLNDNLIIILLSIILVIVAILVYVWIF